jgi:hypothetical protein
MLFKNVENSTNFNFYFDGKLIPLTSDQRTEVQEHTLEGQQQTQKHMRTTILYLLFFGVYNINNFQTIFSKFPFIPAMKAKMKIK